MIENDIQPFKICVYSYSRVEEYFESAVNRVKKSAENMAIRLVSELETGGNVRFEDGTSTDVWLENFFNFDGGRKIPLPFYHFDFLLSFQFIELKVNIYHDHYFFYFFYFFFFGRKMI